MSVTVEAFLLLKGDLVEMVSGGSRDIGRRFIILSEPVGDSLHLVYATKTGKEDRRYTPWSGWYGDCMWEVIERKQS